MLGSLFLPYHTKRSSKKSIRRYSCTYADASTIGLICSYQSLIGENVIDDFVKRLEQAGKKVSLLVFHENSSNTDGLANNSFSKNDLSFFGLWKKEQVRAFIAKEFDFLLLLDLDYNLYISNIIAQSRAHCRIGVYNEEPKPFLELMIKPEESSLTKLIDETHDLLGRLKNEE